MDHLGESAVLDLLRGTTSAEERGHAERHIDSCPECRELISVLAHSGVMTGAARRFGGDPEEDEGDEIVASQWRAGMVIADRFVVEGAAGSGAMGTIFRARDRQGDAPVALKALTYLSADATAWFTREARILAELSHPAVVRYVAHGTTAAPQAYLAMEWLEGEDLAARLARGPLGWRHAVKLARRVAAGLSAAHARGIIHRDVKPSNLFLVGGDPARTVVLDFGVARSAGAMTTATRRGTLVGTPSYMAPEQARARAPVDARADVFSLGCVLHECLTGSRAFAGSDLLEVLAKVLMETPPRVGAMRRSTEDGPIPARLETLVAAMLQKDPARRPASCAELDAELAQIELGSGRRARAPVARSALLVGTLAVAATAGAGWALAPASTRAPAAIVAPTSPPRATTAPSDRPLGLLVLGFENRTTDPLFDRVPGIVLVSAIARSWKFDPYEGTALRSLAAELEEVPGPLDERVGRELAARDGSRVATVRGAVLERGSGFELQVTVGDPVTGEVLATFHREARERRDVVDAIGLLATDVRHRLGDTDDVGPPEATDMSSSLEADNELKLGVDIYDTGQQDQWMAHARRALKLDPSFVKAHWVMGTLLSNLDREDEALAELRLAAPGMGSLSERGQLLFAGDLASSEGDFPRAIAAYGAFLAKAPHDTPAQSRLASVYEQLGDYPHSLEWAVREAADHPKEVVGRANVVILSLLAGRLDETADEARQVMDEFPHPPAIVYLALAESAAIRGQRDEALQALADVERIDAPGGLRALADLQMADGHAAEAVTTLERALARTPEGTDPEEAAATWALLTEAQLRAKDIAAARATLHRGKTSDKAATQFALIEELLEAGDEGSARALARRMPAGHMPRDRHYKILVKALEARHERRFAEAITLGTQALAVSDSWIARRELALSRLAAGDLDHGRDELRLCGERAGAGAFALADDPTLRYLTEARRMLADVEARLATRE